MKKYILRSVILSMAFVLLMSMIACQSTPTTSGGTSTSATTKQPTATTPADKQNLTDPATFPIVNDKITLSIMTPNPGGNKLDLNNNAFTDWYEEHTNIHIQWEIIASGSATENVNLALSTGNLPDAFMSCGITEAMQIKYGGQNAFIPLNEYIDRSVYYKQAAEAYPKFYATNVMPDGNIYSIPNFSDTYHMSWPSKMWVYKPFLTALDIDEPTTTEEFYEMLKSFKDDDPNGNGLADEIPFSGRFAPGANSIESYIMSAFITCSTIKPNGSAYRMIVDNGQLVSIYTQAQYKEGLKYFNRLYSEELLDPQSFTQSGDQLKALGENEVPILGASMGNFSGVFTQWGAESGRCYDYIAISPIQGPGGSRVAATNYWKGATGKYVITSSCENPEAAFRWGEGFYDEGIMIRAIYGIPEQDWFVPGSGEMGINGLPAKWKGGVEQNQDQNTAWYLIMPYYRTADFRLSQAADNPEKNLEVILYNTTMEKYSPYGQAEDTIAPIVLLSDELNEEAAGLYQNIVGYVDQFFTQAVMGQVNIDNEWDRYINQLNTMGYARLMEIYQQAYDTQYK